MSKTLAARRAPSLQEIQLSFPEVGIASRAVLEDHDWHPEASIKGDFGIIVTEQEVARGPITGRYTVETQDMREPLFVRWHAQHGRIQNRAARSTAIAFDLCGTRAGQIWTAVITAQVTDAETCDTIISGNCRASHFPLIMLSERMLEAATRFLEEAFIKLAAKARSSTRTR